MTTKAPFPARASAIAPNGTTRETPASAPARSAPPTTSHIGAAIREFPQVYAELSLRLAKTGQQEERVSGSREAPVPVDLDVQAFMRHVLLVP